MEAIEKERETTQGQLKSKIGEEFLVKIGAKEEEVSHNYVLLILHVYIPIDVFIWLLSTLLS